MKIPGYIHIYDKLRELTELTGSCLKIHTGILYIYIFAYACLQLISRDQDFPPRKSVFISCAISYITAVSYSGILLMINLSHNILSLSTLIERSREEWDVDSILCQVNKGRAAFDQLEADDNSFLWGKKSTIHVYRNDKCGNTKCGWRKTLILAALDYVELSVLLKRLSFPLHTANWHFLWPHRYAKARPPISLLFKNMVWYNK